MIPYFPQGATLFSVANACALTGTRIAIRTSAGRLINGWNSNHLYEQCFPASITLETVLRRHTLLPIHLNLMHPDEAREMLRLHVTGVIPSIYRLHVLATSELTRRCPACVANDVDDVGVAFARVNHQLIGISRCERHGVPLEEVCFGCNRPYSGRTPRLTSDLQGRSDYLKCRHCASEKGVALEGSSSSVDTTFASLVEKLRGENGHISPRTQRHVVEAAVDCLTKDGSDAVDGFTQALRCRSLEDAARRFGAPADHVKSALSDFGTHYSPSARLAVAAFAQDVLSQRNIEYCGSSCDLADRPTGVGCSQHWGNVYQKALDHGLSGSQAEALLSGRNFSASAAYGRRIHAFLSGLLVVEQEFLEQQRLVAQRMRLTRRQEGSEVQRQRPVRGFIRLDSGPPQSQPPKRKAVAGALKTTTPEADKRLSHWLLEMALWGYDALATGRDPPAL